MENHGESLAVALDNAKALCRMIEWGERNSVIFNASKTQLCEISRLIHKNKNETLSFDSTPLEKESSVFSV